MTDRERREVIDAVRGEGGEGPRHRRAPVVPHHVSAGNAGVGQHGEHVARERGDPVGPDLRGFVGTAVPAHVGHDHLEPRPGQRRDLVAPEPPRVGEAVQQHHRSALAGDLVLDAHALMLGAHAHRCAR